MFYNTAPLFHIGLHMLKHHVGKINTLPSNRCQETGWTQWH